MPGIKLDKGILALMGTMFIIFNSVAYAERSALEWSGDIRPGLSESDLESKLDNLAIQFYSGGKGLTYTSKLRTDQRDYLFCENNLYAIVEGAFVSGREFNAWFQAFLAAHERYGEPVRYSAEKDWGRFRAEWELDDGSTLYFQLQSNLEDKHGWSRQLYAESVGKTCQ